MPSGVPLIEVTRGPLVESVHSVAACVADAGGRLALALGDIETPVYLRSAAKPFIAAEVVASGAVLGVKAHHWLGFRDGELDDERGLIARLVALVRAVRPDVVVTPDPTAVFFGQHYVNHRDHRVVGWAALDAVSPAAGNPHYFPDAGPPHRVGLLYLSGTLEADVWVDITETIEVKAAAIACHYSQVGDNGEWLRRAVRQRAEEAGRQVMVPFAEGYRRVQLE